MEAGSVPDLGWKVMLLAVARQRWRMKGKDVVVSKDILFGEGVAGLRLNSMRGCPAWTRWMGAETCEVEMGDIISLCLRLRLRPYPILNPPSPAYGFVSSADKGNRPGRNGIMSREYSEATVAHRHVLFHVAYFCSVSSWALPAAGVRTLTCSLTRAARGNSSAPNKAKGADREMICE